MEWLADDPERGETLLMAIALAIAAVIILLGRKRLLWAITGALVFLLLAAIAIPSWIPARAASQRAACIANLKQIRDVKIQWAEANHKAPDATPTEADLSATNRGTGILREFPACPRGGIYTIGSARQNPTCTFTSKGHRLD